MKIVPPLDYIGASSSGERKFARILSDVTDDEAVAYHSVHLTNHRTQIMGEADFVVLWKGAVIVLEIKGGRLSRSSGVWFTTDRKDNTHRLTKSPWDQVIEARFALQSALEKVVPGVSRPFAHAVVTPDQDLPGDPEWSSEEYLGLSKMTPARVAAALDQLSRKARTIPGQLDYHGRPRLRPIESLAPLKSVLRKDVDRMRTTNEHELVLEEELVALFPGQAVILDQIEDNPRVVVHGGAGTGKTLIAIEAARRESQAGSDVVFTCGSEGVLEHAKSLLEGSSVRIFRTDELPAVPPCQVLVVDEAQDLMNTDDMIRLDDSVQGSLENGRWWMFLDGNNQAHVAGAFDHAVLDEVTGLGCRVSLRNNIRNARSVVTAVQSYLGADLGTPKVGEGPRVDVVQADDQEQIIRMVNDRLKQLSKDGVDRKRISIVSASSNAEESAFAVDGNLPARYCAAGVHYELISAAQVKGLERDHVLVVDVALEDTIAKNNAYVAFTRPRFSLWICVSKECLATMTATAMQQLKTGGLRR